MKRNITYIAQKSILSRSKNAVEPLRLPQPDISLMEIKTGLTLEQQASRPWLDTGEREPCPCSISGKLRLIIYPRRTMSSRKYGNCNRSGSTQAHYAERPTKARRWIPNFRERQAI